MGSKKIFEIIVGFFCLVTVILLVSLTVALAPTWYEGLIVGIGICSFFGFLIYLGINQHRVRIKVPRSSKDSAVQDSPKIEITLTENPYGSHSGQMSLKSLIMLGGIISFLFLMLFMQFDIVPDLGLIIFFFVFFGFIVFLPLVLYGLNTKSVSSQTSSGADVIKKLVIDSQGILLPIEIITKNAHLVALKHNQSQIFIPWKEILSWKIYGSSGKSQCQHSLELTGDSKKYAGFVSVIGIIRTNELKRYDEEIIQIASRYLDQELEICVDNVGLRFRSGPE